MKGPGKLYDTYPDLEFLLKGCPPTTRIHHASRLISPEAYEKQAASVDRRGSNASIVGLLVLENSLIVVERTGSNAGFALPSGSVDTHRQESFLEALVREAHEEAGVELEPDSLVPQGVEIRTFINTETRAKQHVIVGTVLGHLATRQTPHLTPTAQEEGIVSVAAYPINDMPELVFRDGDLVRAAFPNLAA